MQALISSGAFYAELKLMCSPMDGDLGAPDALSGNLNLDLQNSGIWLEHNPGCDQVVNRESS
ncbi:MAG: hypothetical protein EA367_11710 [Leptolyngbya sp. DLM2.Bin15]|nr:MAG: hypothetical protein EA367_11710 [Leptolyngbya sp. DLM2.Bin15]